MATVQNRSQKASSSSGITYIIGAGLAGLRCALELADSGRRVIICEASPHAGGRCRSYHDPILKQVLDNGNHLILSGNREVKRYLERIKASQTLYPASEDGFPFFDLERNRRYSVRLSSGMIPFWLLSEHRRIPETRLTDYVSAIKLLFCEKGATMAQCIAKDHPLCRPFWQPLCESVLNTPMESAAASLMKPVLLQCFARGMRMTTPIITRHSLGASLIDPALAALETVGATIRFNHRIRNMAFDTDGKVIRLEGPEGSIDIADQDRVVLATPSWIAQKLIPGLSTPGAGLPIVNIHFQPDYIPKNTALITGLLGGLSQWVFIRERIASVTISAATYACTLDEETLIKTCWSEVSRLLYPDLSLQTQQHTPPPCPPYRLVKEKRATFDQSPEAIELRPGPRSKHGNLYYSGDWIDTGLPATIEGALTAGRITARAVITDLS